jgi:hypothetical protein
MADLDYAPPVPRGRMITPAIITGALLFPVFCTGVVAAGQLLNDHGAHLAPALEWLLAPLDSYAFNGVFPIPVSLLISVLYLAAPGGFLGWVIPYMPRRLLTVPGLAVCLIGTGMVLWHARGCVRHCDTPWAKIDWRNCTSVEADAIQWSLYAIFFSAFTFFLCVLYPFHRRSLRRSAR